MLKTYNQTPNLAYGFIKSSKFFLKVLIFLYKNLIKAFSYI